MTNTLIHIYSGKFPQKPFQIPDQNVQSHLPFFLLLLLRCPLNRGFTVVGECTIFGEHSPENPISSHFLLLD